VACRGSPESALLHQQMADYGFAVIFLGEEEGLRIDNMFEVGKKFFALDKESKEIHLDPKAENMGYVNVEVREHIKVLCTR
jgi:isopenicillin N synthase-like dioxygenase